ncbi:hypothetical protein BC941DRAFT_518221 [Chlamydoabsidia padenii]|nr:hypothetical protein BC941DRAFT_518221 [Chlamydoabsidia padenii]
MTVTRQKLRHSADSDSDNDDTDASPITAPDVSIVATLTTTTVTHDMISDTAMHENHEIRQLSTAQYYTNAGFKKSMATINSSKSAVIQALEAAIHTNRTTTMDGLKFLNYQGRQRLNAEMVNIFINGGKKYNHRRLQQQSPPERRRRRDDEDRTSPIAPANPAIKERKWKKASSAHNSSKVPVVVFGAATFGRNTFKGKPAGLADKCRKILQKADKDGRLVLIDMDEFNTSHVCSGISLL